MSKCMSKNCLASVVTVGFRGKVIVQLTHIFCLKFGIYTVPTHR